MNIALSVICGDSSYYMVFPSKKSVVIGEQSDSDLAIPGFGYRLTVTVNINSNSAVIAISSDKTSRIINAELEASTVVDFDRRIAVYLSRAEGNRTTVQLPSVCEVRVGKNEKISSDGSRNEIVLDFPFISREHFRILRINEEMQIIDSNSTNGLFVNGRRVSSSKLNIGDIVSIFTVRMIVEKNSLVFENVGNHIQIREISEPDTRKEASKNPLSDSQLKFSRSPRLSPHIESNVITLEHPPQAGSVPQINWLSVLLTPLISVSLMLVLVFVMGMSAVMLIMSGVMSVVSAIIAVINYRNQKKKFGETDDKIKEKYQNYLENISYRLNSAHEHQKHSMLSANPSPFECCSIVANRSRRLWERRALDPDFLEVRLGLGSVPAALSGSFQQAQVVVEENTLEEEARALAENSRIITEAPILSNLSDGKLIGVVGDRQDEILLMRNIVSELVTAHSYDELKLVVLIPEREKESWSWIRWLPHCSDNRREKRYFFTSPDEAEDVLSEIDEVLGRRKNDNNGFRETSRADVLPHYLFIIAAYPWIERHPIRKHLFSDSELGCSSLFIYDRLNALPKECNQIIEVSEGNGILYSRTNSNIKTQFRLDLLDLADADRLARSMAPLYTEAEQAAASIPTKISFLEGYHVSRPEQLNIPARWEKARPYKSLSVPIAATAGGDIFEFDIHEKRHGVNGIVAGMPGSGKTEMVQSWLLSLAVNFSPQDLSFVLIDFKGTGMIAPFRKLPHLAGSISNLDTNIDRNLTAIRSEVHRREAVLDKYSNRSIKNINDLNQSYAQGLVPEKLPILLIVIDEYAEFKKIFPDFGAEIDSLTSKGRALGIFVILMTQKPAGVVSSKSEDNIKFRWCLRVANYSASREMLGRPDAAKINNPGRAFIKIGEDDVFEEVQSFWSGAPYAPSKGNQESDFIPISRVEWDGTRKACESREKTETESTGETEIDAVVAYIAEYCRQIRLADAEKVWTDRLPDRLALTDILSKGFNGTIWPETSKAAPVIGVIDEPEKQRQYPMQMDFSRLGHTAVYGAPVTGKTTLLQTLIMSLAISRKPDEVSIYIMDFGGWNMSVLRDLPHVGGIANDNEPQRLNKLVLLLEDILQERKVKFSEAGVSNITAYRDSCTETIPDVFLIVDNFGALIKMYPNMDSFFISLTNTGANYGVYLIATATATNAIPMKISQNIKNALALQLIDKSEYTYTVGRVSSTLPSIMGRGYAKGNPPLEFQTALPAPGADDKAVSDNIRKLAKRMREVWTGDLPAMIPEMPETIPYGSIKSSGIALGLSVDKVQPVVFDCSKQHYLLLSGTEQSANCHMLQVTAKQLKEKLGGKLYLFGSKGAELHELASVADAHLSAAAEIDAFIQALRPELQRRHTEKQGDPQMQFEPIILAIDDYPAFFKAVNNDTVLRLLAIVKIGKGLGLYLIAAGDAYELTGFFNKGEALTLALGKARQAVMLGGCMNDHGAIPVKASFSQKGVPVREHEGMFIRDGAATVFRAMDIKGE